MFVDVYKAIDDIADFLVSQGVGLPEAYKRRDPKEPGRAIKEMYEDKLLRLIKRRFRTQKKQIAEALRWILPQKAIGNPDEWESRLSDDVWNDDETEAAIMALFVGIMSDGVQLAAEHITIGIDFTQVNTLAVEQARKQFLGWIKDLDDVTAEALRQGLENFASVPGYTLADVMAALPFEDYRALRIATTETTRMFALAEQTAAAELQNQYPELEVTKTWYTNMDDRVCLICGPLEGEVVKADEMWQTVDGIWISMPPAHVNCRCWMMTGIGDG